jgi:hypothetical protein
LKSVCPDLFYLDRSQYFFCLLRLIPEIRTNGYFLLFLNGIEFGIDVKDASSGKLFYPSNPGSVL